MVRIGDVWDSATDVLAGRAGVLAPIAALAFVLPAVAQSALQAWGGASLATAALGGLVAIAAGVISLWGQLAVVAVASDPDVTRAVAGRQALARLPAGLVAAIVLIGLFFLLMLPAALILAAGGVDLAAIRTHRDALPIPSPGVALALLLYALVALAVLVWVGARLFLVNPVVLNEGLAAGAIPRSFALTRGLALKLVGTTLLFGIAWFVAVTAVQAVVGLIARLLLGAELIAAARFLAALAGAGVTAAWIVVVQVFAARLYAAVTGGTGARA